MRRHHDRRMKVKARLKLALDYDLPSQWARLCVMRGDTVSTMLDRTDARRIGAYAAVHGCPYGRPSRYAYGYDKRRKLLLEEEAR